MPHDAVSRLKELGWQQPEANDGPKLYKGQIVKLMSRVDGYLMVRLPHEAPFVITEAEWEALDQQR